MDEVSIDNLKRFIGIKFNEYNSTDVIPKLWIVNFENNKKSVVYPPLECDIQTLSRSESEVSSTWNTYNFTALCHSSEY